MAAPVSARATRDPPTSEQKSAEVSSSRLRKPPRHFPCRNGASDGGLPNHLARFPIRARRVPATPSPCPLPTGERKSARNSCFSKPAPVPRETLQNPPPAAAPQ